MQDPGAGAFERPWHRTDKLLLLALLGVVVWLAGDVLLLVFAAVLLAVGLDGLATGLARRTPLQRGWALALVVVLVTGTLALLGYLVLPQFLAQLDDLWRTLLGFFERLRALAIERGWAEPLEALNNEQGQERLAELASTAAGYLASAVTGAAGALASLVVLTALTLFAAADPALYRRGVLKLLPRWRRARMDETLSHAAHALRWWFLGQIVSMLLLGVTVGVGLMLIGVELWLSLAVLTALLTFIPFLGPIIAGIPIVIVGFTAGTETGLIVLAFYLVVQNIEGNFVVPMIQHRVVNLAPVLLIAVQILMGLLFGAMGLVLAAPLAVVGMVMVQKLYVEDVLGDR